MKIRPPHALLAGLTLLTSLPAAAEIKLLAEGAISARAHDQSRLRGILEDGVTPRDQVGGLGGALAYSGHDQVFYAVPDRGPGAGETTYEERIYTMDLGLKKNGDKYTLEPKITATHVLREATGHPLTGDAAAFDAVNSHASHRRDSEAVRVASNGTSVFIADEYGPFIDQFDISSGKLLRDIPVPNKFHIDYPSKYIREELNRNLIGRQSNRGFESLAITPDGNRLITMVQDPLIQDCDRDAEHKLIGVHNRILDIDLKSGSVKEYVYPLESPKNGVSEILAINDHQFLVLERDSKAGAEAKDKRLYLIDLNGATDVHGFKSLSDKGLTTEQETGTARPVFVQKRPFLDLLSFGIRDVPEKFEAIAFGSDLEDGRHVLVLSSDNDFSAAENTRYFAFAIDRTDLPDFQPQKIATTPASNKSHVRSPRHH